MPYINIKLSKETSDKQILELKSEIGKAIEIIPGKTESRLMVIIETVKSIFLAGEPKENGAFVDVVVYKDCPIESKRDFTAKVFDILYAVLGTPKESVYLNFSFMDNWGSNGALH